MTRVLSKCLQTGRLLCKYGTGSSISKVNQKWNLSRYSTTATRQSSQAKDDSKLWIKSPLPDVPLCTGIEMHELIFHRIASYGNLPAMVYQFNLNENDRIYFVLTKLSSLSYHITELTDLWCFWKNIYVRANLQASQGIRGGVN